MKENYVASETAISRIDKTAYVIKWTCKIENGKKQIIT
jgi:hypothetical protein